MPVCPPGMRWCFIALLYTTAPAVAAFARLNFVETVHDTPYTETPDWFRNWEDLGLIAWLDKNQDGGHSVCARRGLRRWAGFRSNLGPIRRARNEQHPDHH